MNSTQLGNRLGVLVPACALFFGGCGGTQPAGDSGTDGGNETAGCDPTSALPIEWRPIGTVSAGTIAATTAAGVTTATIDATAGGSMAYADNPFIYLDLRTGTKVDSTDVAAWASSGWSLSFKRFAIRVNGGDSGPGGVSVARVTAATLADVTAAPPPAAFVTDDWADPACAFRAGPINEPLGAMADWYMYDTTTSQVTPNPYVWVVQLDATTMFKLRIITYYGDPANPMRGAYYQVEWAPL